MHTASVMAQRYETQKPLKKKLSDYIRENIYRPAGMVNSDAYELDRVNPNLAVGYDKQFGESGVWFLCRRWRDVFGGVDRGRRVGACERNQLQGGGLRKWHHGPAPLGWPVP